MKTQMCDAVYVRDGSNIPCTYIIDHPTERHSWQSLLDQDEADKESGAGLDYTPVVLQALIDGIMAGDLDEYVEDILAAGHFRKRARRGNHTEYVIRLPRQEVDA